MRLPKVRIVSRRILLGRERTAARRGVIALAVYEPSIVAKLLGMRRHTIEAILSGRMLPGRTFAERVSRVMNPA
jgi:hypothetical protein